MDKIRVDTELLEECGTEIRQCSTNMLSLAEDVQAVLSAMPECCGEKYGHVIQSYVKELRSIGNDLDRLQTSVNLAAQVFVQCEQTIRDNANLQTGESAGSGGGQAQASIWDRWPFNWIDSALDWLGIDKYGRDYVDPGAERQQAQDDLIREQISDLFSQEKYSRENWNNATMKEKKQILNDLQEDLNKIYGINISKKVNYFTEQPDSKGYVTLGSYNDRHRQVSINTYALDNFGYDSIMNTMVHEMRHAYQHEVVRHPDRFEVSEETAKSWEYNADPRHYISYDETKNNYDEYRYQPIEADAHDIADNVDYH